jgi:hypothetical protein
MISFFGTFWRSFYLPSPLPPLHLMLLLLDPGKHLERDIAAGRSLFLATRDQRGLSGIKLLREESRFILNIQAELHAPATSNSTSGTLLAMPKARKTSRR